MSFRRTPHPGLDVQCHPGKGGVIHLPQYCEKQGTHLLFVGTKTSISAERDLSPGLARLPCGKFCFEIGSLPDTVDWSNPAEFIKPNKPTAARDYAQFLKGTWQNRRRDFYSSTPTIPTT